MDGVNPAQALAENGPQSCRVNPVGKVARAGIAAVSQAKGISVTGSRQSEQRRTQYE